MKKKKAVLIGIIVLTGALFLNLIISENLDGTDITFSNIEALAQKESGGSDSKAQCIDSGHICIGLDKDGNPGPHWGLVQNPNL